MVVFQGFLGFLVNVCSWLGVAGEGWEFNRGFRYSWVFRVCVVVVSAGVAGFWGFQVYVGGYGMSLREGCFALAPHPRI